MSDWRSYLWYEGVFYASVTSATLGWSLRTEGMKHIPPAGPALLVANHQSFFDPALVGMAARRHLFYLARQNLFKSALLRVLMRSMNAVPIDHQGLGIAGLRVVNDLLGAGHAVVVFPEGTRTPDGVIQPLKSGIQLIIRRNQVPIIPVGIAGAFEAWPRWRPLPIPAPLFLPASNKSIAVSIGRPLNSSRLADLPREQLLAELHGHLQSAHTRAEALRRKPGEMSPKVRIRQAGR